MLDRIVLRALIACIIIILPSAGNSTDFHNLLFEPVTQVELNTSRILLSNHTVTGIDGLNSSREAIPVLIPHVEWQQIGDIPEIKSKGKAFMLSLLLPGLGERYAGAHTKSQIFIGTEILLWTGFAGFTSYNHWRKQDYRAFAATHAGVDLKDKSGSYFIDLEVYNSIYDYNAAILRDRNLRDYYQDVEQYYWQWDSETNRKKFRDLRISADEAYNRSLFAIAAIVANHIISAIDAMWTVHKYNKNIETSDVGINIRFGGSYWNPNLSIGICKQF